jgi:hypothetical protein
LKFLKKKAFPKIKFSLTGIFCHQKPIVDIGLSTAPELGDILFVYIHTDSQEIKATIPYYCKQK